MRTRRLAISVDYHNNNHHHGQRQQQRSQLPATMYIAILLILQITCFRITTANEYVENWSVAENAAIGLRVGKIAANLREIDFEPPFTLIPISGDLSDFIVDPQNGEIRTRNHLDRELCDSYSFVVFPSRGSSIHVTIQVADVNDNRPQFARDFVALEMPENGANVIRSLPAAFDADQGVHAVQNYTILHGNEEGLFAIESNARRATDSGAVFLDLRVRQALDRERRDSYSLVIEARDGGRPPLTGHLRVNITISDVNDNHPVFNQTRYYGTVAVNATVGTPIVRVAASDTDAGDNGRVEFVINRRQSDRNSYFDIGRNDGVIVLNKPLVFSEVESATKSIFELVVIGRDCGKEPLESVTFVTVKVTDAGEQRPIINLIFLDNSHTTTNGKIKESVVKGHYVARVQINEPKPSPSSSSSSLLLQQQPQKSHYNISLIGGNNLFALATKDSSVYVIVAADGTAPDRKLDRELKSLYKLQLVLTLAQPPTPVTGPVRAQSVQQMQQVITKDFEIELLDVNDNAPEFSHSVYYATVSERESESGADLFVVQVQATDADSDRNARITYQIQSLRPQSLRNTSAIRDRFKIDAKTGVISTNGRLDCEQFPNPQLQVLAIDNGQPQLTATAIVNVAVTDTNDNEPQFEQSIYRFNVREDSPLDSLIGKVSASDLDCGLNAIINYSLDDGTVDQAQHQHQQQQSNDFRVDPATGDIRIRKSLDYEVRTAYEFEVFAIDQGGLRTSCLVQIMVQNINDNVPQLLSETITVTIEQEKNSQQRVDRNTVVAKILAHDPDNDASESASSQLTFRQVNRSGGSAGDSVRLNQLNGEFVWNGGAGGSLEAKTDPLLTFNVSVSDNGGLIAPNPVTVRFMLISASNAQFQPIFEHVVYRFKIAENAELMSVIGSVRANLVRGNDHERNLQYSLANEFDRSTFEMDENDGSIRLLSKLDYETKKLYSLTGQVVNTLAGNLRKIAYCQIIIDVIDVNDNEPKLLNNAIRLNVPENWSLKTPLYKIEAKDSDFASDLIRDRFNYKLYHNFENMFRVDRESGGQLFVQKAFDYESGQRQFVLVVEVSDGLLSSNLTITINVQDVNDNAPKFVKNDYYMDVSESLPIRSQIMQLQATDMDSGKNSRIAYKLAKSAASSKFEIDSKTGWLSLQTSLDREQTNRYELEIVARDSGLRRLSATARLHISVTDVNDNAPKFANDLYTFEIEESSGGASSAATKRLIGRVTAFDADDAASLNSKLKFSILTADSPFEIDSDSGKLYAIEALDRETKSSYELMIKVEDQSPQLKRSARALVRINVTDVNDNYPEIIDPQDDLISVREQQPIGTIVVRVRAIDSDFGENATVTYSLVETNGGEDDFLVRERFEIDRFSGEIRTKQVLDYESKSIYRLAVAATDNGQWWRTAASKQINDADDDRRKQSVRLLRVEVLELSDSRPAFTSTSFRFRVRENVAIGSIVGNVLDLKSLDSIENQHFTIDDRLLNDSFLLDRSSGDLIVTKRLDYETRTEYRFEIRTLDLSMAMNPKSLSIAIVIHVDDVNDNRPQWHDLELSGGPILVLYLPENSPVNTIVYNFTATDRDSGENGDIRYQLRNSASDVRDKFDLDELSGVLSLRSMLDYELCNEYRLIVEACDQAGNRTERLKTSLAIRLMIIDANDNRPEFVYPKQIRYPLRVANEKLEIGATVLHVMALDADSSNNGRVSYAIVDGNQERKFAINTETGRIVLTRPLFSTADADRDAMDMARLQSSYYLLNITATDHGVPVKQSSILVNVTLDDGGDGDDEGEETADGSKSKVFIDGMADPSSSRLLRSFYQMEIAENTEIGMELMRIEIAKVSGTSGWKFELAKGLANDTFAVDRQTGVLRLQKSLDHELVKFYSIVVFVTNETSGDYETVTISLSVRNVNDNPPEFARESCRVVHVQENMPFSLIHTLLAYDRDYDDGSSQITYEILDGNAEQKFELNDRTGELFAAELDREQQAAWQLKIAARDSSKWQTICLLTIEVDDVNDNAPIFEQDLYQVQIDENIAIGTFVLAAKAMDEDSGRNAQVVYALANEGQSRFRIDNRTGAIFTLGALDREYRDLYEFDVLAYDMAGEAVGPRQSARVPVRVVIRDLDDNLPVFEQLFYRVTCTAGSDCSHSSLIRVRAYDLDLVRNDNSDGAENGIRYRLRDNDTHFRIDEVTGDVRTTGKLAPNTRYHLWIEIENQPDVKCLIEVLTIDADRQALQFRNEDRFEFELKATELQATYSIVGHVQAFRIDGRRQPIKYRLVLNRLANHFAINEQTGELSYRKRNDSMPIVTASIGRSDELIIEAKTVGEPELLALTSVRVRMVDEQAARPQFEQNEYRADVYEAKRKGQFVTEVRANDMGTSDSFSYQIVDGNHENAFRFEDSASGRIRTNLVLDCEIRSFYRLTVVASKPNALVSATSSVLVRVLDVNDNAPTLPAHQLVEIDENAAIGALVTRIRANDVDSLAQLTYKFDVVANDNQIFDYFTLNTFDGAILLRKLLDYESIREFRMKIIASDSVHEVLTSLTIRVRNTNDNLPVFSQAFYSAEIVDGRQNEKQSLVQVNATDADGDSLKYRLESSDCESCFEIDEVSGQVILRSGRIGSDTQRNYYLLTISAWDSHETRTCVPLFVRKLQAEEQQRRHQKQPQRQKNDKSNSSDESVPKEFKLKLAEDTRPGTVVWKMTVLGGLTARRSRIEIQNGNENLTFAISPANELVLMKWLDRESVESYLLNLKIYSLTVAADATNDSLMLMKLCTIAIEVEDVNDNRPVFETLAAVSVQENVAIGSRLLTAHALDADRANTANSQLNYTIVAGNECGSFEIETRTGHLIVRKSLDYDSQMAAMYSLVIECCDNGGRQRQRQPQCSLAVANITLRDANDNRPAFATEVRYVNVAENEPIGTAVAVIRAYDSDAGAYGNLKYVLSDAAHSVGVTAATTADRLSSLFRIDSRTGLISTNAVFDYETERRFVFCVQAFDVDGFSASVVVHVRIESRDEFYPQFTLRTYTFFMRSDFYAGSILGYVKATDADSGLDGRLVYSLSTKNPYFRVNGSNGAIMLKNTIENEISIDNRPVSIVVTAGSGRQNSLTNVTVVEIHFDDNLTGNDFIIGVSDSSAAAAAAAGTVANSTSAFAIGLILVIAVTATFAFALLAVYRKHWLNFDFLSRTSIRRGSIPDALRRTRSNRTTNGSFKRNAVIASSAGTINSGGSLGGDSANCAGGNGDGAGTGLMRRVVPASETKLVLNSSSTTVSSIGNNYAVPGPPFESVGNAHLSLVKTSTGGNGPGSRFHHHLHQTQPPKYDEIQAYGLSLNGSERSERSRSSGRGSAEDADEEIVDEEIHMITTGSRTKEYLAKLGIRTTTTTAAAEAVASAASAEHTATSDDAVDTISSSETIMSGVGNCHRQMQPFNCALHSADMSQPAEWTPQYQPLAHVFTEIARLKGGAVTCAAPAAVSAVSRRRDCDNMSMRSCASSVRSGGQQLNHQHQQPATRRTHPKIALYDTIGGGTGGSSNCDFSSSDDGQSSTSGLSFVKKPQTSSAISAAAAAIVNAAAASTASSSYSGIAIAPTFEQSLSPLQSKPSPSNSPIPTGLAKTSAPLPAVRFGFRRNAPPVANNHRRTLENEERI